MPPASKKFLANDRARGELGDGAEIGEEDFRPRAGLGQHAVGGVAQRFERLGEADAAAAPET